MLLCLREVLTAEDLAQVRDIAGEAGFDDGRRTAGRAARDVKNNLQMETGPRIDTVRGIVRRALDRHALFGGFAQPKSISRMLVSRYGPGMEYGAHVDDALMAGRRADLSFTLFLSDPDSYDGGELVIDSI